MIMSNLTMTGARSVAPETYELGSFLPVPDLGLLAVNSFLINAREPMLVDTGLGALEGDYLETLGGLIDPADLKWIWLSHMDPDHLGNLRAVLDFAPNAKVVTNFLGMGKMGLAGLPVDRVHLLEPGARLDLGDRQIVPLRPPYYDAPETIGFFDTKSRALFSADAFGALLQSPAENAAEIGEAELRDGMTIWTAIDAPWLGLTDAAAFGRTLSVVERLDPSIVLSGHLPHAPGMTLKLTRLLDGVSRAGRVDAPGHDEIERLVEEARLH
jgi:glyoxylase-like metal-dependent hydrolase (beta-lactamase superfamily II)